MRGMIAAGLGILALAGIGTLPSQPAQAQAVAAPAIARAATEIGSVDLVQYRRYHGGRTYYRGRGNAGAAVGAGILGIAAGAIIAGSIAQQQAAERVDDDRWLANCARRYRSFDPSTGTYLARDGRRYYCEY